MTAVKARFNEFPASKFPAIYQIISKLVPRETANFVSWDLAIFAIFVAVSFNITRKILVTFAIFAKTVC